VRRTEFRGLGAPKAGARGNLTYFSGRARSEIESGKNNNRDRGSARGLPAAARDLDHRETQSFGA
jgi:hypothetical protein